MSMYKQCLQVAARMLTQFCYTPHTTRHLGICFYLLSVLLLAACEQAAVSTPVPTTITIAGATAMQPVLLNLTDAFSHQHPNVLFHVRGGGSTVGEERLLAGQVDLAASSLLPATPLTPTLTPSPLVRIPIGIDGLAIVVHPSNPISNVTVLQLRELYSGRLLTWSELGTNAGEVVLVSREDGSGSRQLFEERVMGDEHVSLTAVVMPTSADVVDYVAKNPQAVGYVSRAYVVAWLDEQQPSQASQQPSVEASTPPAHAVRVVRLEGQLPTRENLQTQRYFLTQPLFLLSRGEPEGWAHQFVDFVLGPAGQEIVAKYHARVR
jgi:phosphate transport system substrate-binding protein